MDPPKRIPKRISRQRRRRGPMLVDDLPTSSSSNSNDKRIHRRRGKRCSAHHTRRVANAKASSPRGEKGVILAQTASLNHVKMLHSGGGVAALVKQPEPATFPRGGKAAQPSILHKTNQEQTGPPPPPTFALQIPKPVSMPGPVSANTRVQFMSSSESVSSSIDPYASSGSSVPNWHRG